MVDVSTTTVGSPELVPGPGAPRRVVDVLDGGLAALAARAPTTTVGLDQLWRTARRRTRRAMAAVPAARAFDLAALGTDRLRPPPGPPRGGRAAIVASGPSALLVHQPGWAEALREMDVFALNHAAAIAPDPVVCSIEVPDLVGRQAPLTAEQGVAFLEWAVARARRSSGCTSVVVRANALDGPTLALLRRVDGADGATRLAMQAGLSVRGRDGSTRFARWVASRDAMRWPAPGHPFVCARGGLGFLVALTVALGYDETVLFGVDLWSNDYFFDLVDPDELPGVEAFTPVLAPSMPVPHSTAVARRDRPGIVDALAALDVEVLRPRGRRLAVASERSLLHPALDLAEPGTR